MKKLSIYFKRSKWLEEKYFTPRTLVLIANYFQHSRINYGMKNFIDLKGVADEVEKKNMMFTKDILGLHNGTNSNRLRLKLNRPNEEKKLWVKLRKVIIKNTKHFNESLTIYDDVDKKMTE